MKKKILALLLMIVLALGVTACEETTSDSKFSAETEEEEDDDDDDDEKENDDDKNDKTTEDKVVEDTANNTITNEDNELTHIQDNELPTQSQEPLPEKNTTTENEAADTTTQEHWIYIEGIGYIDPGMETTQTNETSFRTTESNIDITLEKRKGQTCKETYETTCQELNAFEASYNSACLYSYKDGSYTYEAYLIYIPSESEDIYIFVGTYGNYTDSVFILISGYAGCDKKMQQIIAENIAASFFPDET